ncbi:hypothetical protein C8P66_11851 [Humitalea rosea]|uniref:Uncharacterized protein n=1 Tax=Humitalea rosea TaxID=990373 RepID=A0A2W7IB02_9PROT|nr:alpha/beta hydrolase domain-containing protein [Humitalea rosea]PZW42265.1 hypothetical protein C8P66_11851 [Humitalea rosea]
MPAVDADGNERAGVRLPNIAVPLGIYTGGNLYRADASRADASRAVALAREPCDREGSFIPFARTAAEGDAAAPRPAVTERFATRRLCARGGSHGHTVALNQARKVPEG